jgi:hypothetical protein
MVPDCTLDGCAVQPTAIAGRSADGPLCLDPMGALVPPLVVVSRDALHALAVW